MRPRLTYANVMATAAVFIALGGGAYAVSLANNSVGSKQIKPNAVKGKDAKESSFAQVPSAASADDAALLDGMDSTAFASGDAVHDSGRVSIDDPTPGDTVHAIAPLIADGPWTVQGECAQNAAGSTDYARIRVTGPANSSFAGDSGAVNEVTVLADSEVLVASLADTGNDITSAYLVAIAPSGDALSLHVSTELNDASGGTDCTFGATAVG